MERGSGILNQVARAFGAVAAGSAGAAGKATGPVVDSAAAALALVITRANTQDSVSKESKATLISTAAAIASLHAELDAAHAQLSAQQKQLLAADLQSNSSRLAIRHRKNDVNLVRKV